MEKRRTWTRAVQGVWVSALLLGGAQSAAAEECTDDADCGDGFVCEAQQQGCATIDIACADGEKCPQPEPCNAQEIHVCVAAPCDSDADCGDTMVCYTQTWMSCSGGGSRGCAPDEKCEPEAPVEPSCTTETMSQCVPPWVPPCEEDADCGPGFRCVEEIERGCSGSAGRPPSDNGEPAPPPPPPSCFENPTGRFICELVETACGVDSDCGAGLTCQSNPNAAVCGGTDIAPAIPGNSNDSDRPVSGCPEPTAPMRVCLPPNYGRDLGGSGGIAEDGSAQPTSGAPKGDENHANNGDTDDGEDAAEMAPRIVRHGCSAAGATTGNWLGFATWLLVAAAPVRRRKR